MPLMIRRRWEPPRQGILLALAVVSLLVVGILLARLYQLPDATKLPAEFSAPSTAGNSTASPRPSSATADEAQNRKFDPLRANMIEQQLIARGIDDPRVLEAMKRVPRHEFVPDNIRDQAYRDGPLPIGHGQTISQPLIVAMMTQLVQPSSDTRTLDVGTGSGYQSAILAELVDQVYSIEILEPLATEARDRLQAMGYENIEVRCGDGYRGWPEQAPFDAIIVAAAPDHIPQALVDQLAPGGRLVIPVGPRSMQNLILVEKQTDGTIQQRTVTPVTFVPMTGEAEE